LTFKNQVPLRNKLRHYIRRFGRQIAMKPMMTALAETWAEATALLGIFLPEVGAGAAAVEAVADAVVAGLAVDAAALVDAAAEVDAAAVEGPAVDAAPPVDAAVVGFAVDADAAVEGFAEEALVDAAVVGFAVDADAAVEGFAEDAAALVDAVDGLAVALVDAAVDAAAPAVDPAALVEGLAVDAEALVDAAAGGFAVVDAVARAVVAAAPVAFAVDADVAEAAVDAEAVEAAVVLTGRTGCSLTNVTAQSAPVQSGKHAQVQVMLEQTPLPLLHPFGHVLFCGTC